MTTSRWISRSVSKARRVEGDVDRALDRVLDGHEPEVDLAGLGRAEHVGNRAQCTDRAGGQVGLGEQRLLGEGAPRGRGSRPSTASQMVHDRSRQGRMVHPSGEDARWTRPPCGVCSTRWRAGDRPRRRRRPSCGACRSPISGFARVDHHRALRQGMAEAVYGPGKTPEQCVAIVAELLGDRDPARCCSSRCDDAQAAAVLAVDPDAAYATDATVVWRPAALRARARSWSSPPAPPTSPSPTSASPRSPAHGVRPAAPRRRRRRRPAPAAGRRRPTRQTPTPSSWSPAWRVRWPAWSAVSTAGAGRRRAHERRATERRSTG